MAKTRKQKPKKTADFQLGIKHERGRILAFLKLFKDQLGDNYFAIHNRIIGGDDPRDPDYMDDRLMP